MATLSAAFHRKSANPSAPQRPTTPTKITVAPLIHPAFPFQNHQATQRLALNPHSPTPPPAHTTPRFPPSRLFGRLPPCIRSRPRTAGIRKPLTEAAVPPTGDEPLDPSLCSHSVMLWSAAGQPSASIAFSSPRRRIAVAQAVQRRDPLPETAGIWRMSVNSRTRTQSQAYCCGCDETSAQCLVQIRD